MLFDRAWAVKVHSEMLTFTSMLLHFRSRKIPLFLYDLPHPELGPKKVL